MTTAEQVANNLVLYEVETPLLISYSLINNDNGDSAKEIKVIFNGADTAQTITIPQAEWTILAEDAKINPAGLGTTKGGSITIAPRSATILAQ